MHRAIERFKYALVPTCRNSLQHKIADETRRHKQTGVVYGCVYVCACVYLQLKAAIAFDFVKVIKVQIGLLLCQVAVGFC